MNWLRDPIAIEGAFDLFATLLKSRNISLPYDRSINSIVRIR